MSLIEALLNSQNNAGGLVGQLARNFNLDESQAESAVKAVMPSISGAMNRNLQQPGGLDNLLAALQGGKHSQFIDDYDRVDASLVKNEGNAILGHLFGDKQVSREVAKRASSSTGLDSGLLKQLLPVIASMAMGALSKQGNQGGIADRPGTPGGADSGGLLKQFLDADNDGSVADDLFDLARKFF